MKCLSFVVLFLVYFVRCEDNNYYVIRAPEDEPRLKVYWNVPTMQCASKKIYFENLYQKYGIYQNKNDRFQGEKVTIMYDPGLFPALLKNETSGQFKFRNGGVPQEGDLDKHLEAFKKDLDLSVPDRGFDGIGIIDFESWRPIFRQNFGVLQPYKDVSYEIERKLHWWWHKARIEAEAKRRFESAARLFMQATIELARELRPKGLWGFYGFPYCFNMASNNMVESCASQVPQENDRISWLWRSSTALYPSVYSSASLSTAQLAALIRGRVKEARRVGGKSVPVLPYFWYRYRDASFLSKTDLRTALATFYKSNASGFIIWGSSNDVNTVDKCQKLLDYVERVLGPAIAMYTKITRRDEIDHDFDDSTTEMPNSNDELSTEDKVDITQDIKKQIAEEIRKKYPNYAPINEDNTSVEETAVLNNNVLVNLIINSMLNNEINSFNNNISTTEGLQNIVNFITESSLDREDTNKSTVTNIYDNNSNNNNVITKSTTDYNVFSTTESAVADESIEEKGKTQLDNFSSTTEYNLENDLLAESSTIGSDLFFKTTDTTAEFWNVDFTSSTKKSKLDETNSTPTIENEMTEEVEFFNLDTFDIDKIYGTTEFFNDIYDKNNKKDWHNKVTNKETEPSTVTELYNIDKEFSTDNTKQYVTTEPLDTTTYINTYNIETSTKTETPGVKIRTTDSPQEILDTTTDRTNFDETTANSTNNDVKSFIEDSTAISPIEDKVVVYVL